ncbi:azurin [Chromatocurvus halotolerans]|uniref:Azurin n=1 Tax=Chromatocurvus halotolerans TaxID=1132028 RepID=A0A4R2L016_9GAMM|nr:azurin [Chromatocurvus halotolerans]TCO78527.1 azurin [Chromatocurvus halotolerans]
MNNILQARTPAGYIRGMAAVSVLSALVACGGNEPGSESRSSERSADESQPTRTVSQAESGEASEGRTGSASSADQGTQPSESADRVDEGDANVASDCTFDVEVGDNLQYSVSQITAPADCSDFTLNLVHTGKLPANAMGHNWVLVPEGAGLEIARAGSSKGLEGDYLADDERIIAATEVIGGGESASITFSLDGLDGDYTYVCTYPGHGAAMRGTFSVRS